jgi:hypothetical protein
MVVKLKRVFDAIPSWNRPRSIYTKMLKGLNGNREQLIEILQAVLEMAAAERAAESQNKEAEEAILRAALATAPHLQQPC